MGRVTVNGKIRRIAASRIAWALATGDWPKGVVRHRNGDEGDCRQENLLLTRHGRDPFGAISNKHSKGGKASVAPSGARDDDVDQDAHRSSGRDRAETSQACRVERVVRLHSLEKLADMGLTCGPKCDARARWDLTPPDGSLPHQPSRRWTISTATF